MDPKTGKLIEGDIKEQTRRVLHNIKAVLQAGKAAFSDVVSVTVYMTDLKDFKEMNEVYQEYFSSPYPARATVGVAALPAGAKVEISVIAHARSE
jgi:2-iminobutanoate/2-iminopropanoate deaminase